MEIVFPVCILRSGNIKTFYRVQSSPMMVGVNCAGLAIFLFRANLVGFKRAYETSANHQMDFTYFYVLYV